MFIEVIGLGPGSPDLMPLGTLKRIEEGLPLFLRTGRHPTVDFLRERGIGYSSFDDLYEKLGDFGAVYRAIAGELIEAARDKGGLLYAVPGHPLVAEDSVRLLLEKAPPEVEVIIGPGSSFLDALFGLLAIDPSDGLYITDAFEVTAPGFRLPPRTPVIISQVYDRRVASEVKLALMNFLDDEEPIVLASAAHGKAFKREMPLYELDRQKDIDHLSSVYLPPARRVKGDFEELVGIVSRLRSPIGCPWDREQTHLSLRRYLMEESYEVLEALDEGDMNKLLEELGDLLLQIVLHAQLARESGEFDIGDVIESVSAKMIRRHPHVFGNVTVRGSQDVVRNWEAIKEGEKGEDRDDSILKGVPVGLPALLRADKVQRKAARVGFDWGDWRGPLEKLRAEIDEFVEAAEPGGNEDQLEEEMGDILFSVVNLGRYFNIDPESALRRTIEKFTRRFRYIEEKAAGEGHGLEEMTLEEMDELWEAAKRSEKEGN